MKKVFLKTFGCPLVDGKRSNPTLPCGECRIPHAEACGGTKHLTSKRWRAML